MMNLSKTQWLFLGIEIVGVIVLILVLTALTSLGIPLELYRAEAGLFCIMMLAVAFSILSGLVHIVNIVSWRAQHYTTILTEARPVLGVLLVLLGMIAFFGLPQYFYTLADVLTLTFWERVSAYSLPAICVEGGLFTLCSTLLEAQEVYLSRRERTFVLIGMLSSTTIAVAGNFLVLTGVIDIGAQVITARAILVGITLIAAGFLIWPKKKVL